MATSQRNASILLTLKNDASPEVKQLVGDLRTATIAAGQGETKFLELAGALSTQALKAGDAARADQILAEANRGLAPAAESVSKSVAGAGDAMGAANQFAGAFTSSLIRMAGPVALAHEAFKLAKDAVQSFGDALHFEGQLQETRAAFDGVYGSVNVGNAVLDRAIAAGRAYGFTTKDVSTAFRELSPIIRDSTASTQDQIGALARFSVLHPEDAVNQLKTAVEGLQSGGRITAIAKDLGLTTDEQEKLKASVKGGTDVFVALNAVMDAHGVTLKTAAERMDGYAGAERRAAQANEDLQQAQAQFASGPGTKIVQEQTTLLEGLTRLLTGDYTSGLKATIVNQQASTAAYYATSAAISDGKTQAEAAAIGQAAFAASVQQSAAAATPAAAAHEAYAAAIAHGATQAQAQKVYTDALADASNGAAIAVLRSADADDRAAAAAANATGPILKLTDAQIALANATGLADQRKSEQTGTDLSAKQFDDFSKLARTRNNEIADEKKKADDKAAADAKRTADKAAADAKRLDDLQNQNKLIHAKTAADKIAELQRQKATTSDPIERQQLQNQIDQESIAAAKAHGAGRVSAAQSTALQLNNVEENSGLQLLKTQRENNERLADAQQDFDLRRARSKEDEDRKIQSLLAHGQKAAADRERADFARQQARDQQDFNITRQRTIRNNNEATGDLGNRTALRTEQIQDRAALRGVRTGGAAGAPESGGTVAGPVAPASGGGRVIQVILPSSLVTPDGKQIATIVYPYIAAQIDADLSIELRGANPPGSNQTAVAGARP